MLTKKRTLKDWIIYIVISVIIIAAAIYFMLFFKPRNSLELYQELHFSESFEEVQKQMLDGYEDNFTEEDFNYIQSYMPSQIGQFTLFDYNSKSYVIMTTPGTEILKVLAVEELPEEVRMFFSKLMK